MTPFAHNSNCSPKPYTLCCSHYNIASASASVVDLRSRNRPRPEVFSEAQLLMDPVCGRLKYICGMRGSTIGSLYRFSGATIGNYLQSKIRFEISIIELLSNLCHHDPKLV